MSKPLLMRKGDYASHTRGERMTFTKARFASFEEYLTADSSDLPDGRCEYWDGELIEVMSESLVNEATANYLYLLLVQMGIYYKLLSPGKVQIVVNGKPRTRFPDLTVLDDAHLVLMKSSTLLGATKTSATNTPIEAFLSIG